MIGYVTLGTNDIKKYAPFYDALAKEMGVGRMMDMEGFVAWGAPGQGALVSLIKPANGEAACIGNGVMVAIAAQSKEQVDRLYKIARDMGGADEGPPGQRSPNFYAAYFRDLEGHKLNAFFMG